MWWGSSFMCIWARLGIMRGLVYTRCSVTCLSWSHTCWVGPTWGCTMLHLWLSKMYLTMCSAKTTCTLIGEKSYTILGAAFWPWTPGRHFQIHLFKYIYSCLLTGLGWVWHQNSMSWLLMWNSGLISLGDLWVKKGSNKERLYITSGGGC